MTRLPSPILSNPSRTTHRVENTSWNDTKRTARFTDVDKWEGSIVLFSTDEHSLINCRHFFLSLCRVVGGMSIKIELSHQANHLTGSNLTYFLSLLLILLRRRSESASDDQHHCGKRGDRMQTISSARVVHTRRLNSPAPTDNNKNDDAVEATRSREIRIWEQNRVPFFR